MTTKICSKCKIEKPITEFHKNKSKKDGYGHICKKCRCRAKQKETFKHEFKRCNNGTIHCNKIKSLEEFVEDIRLLDGRRNQCKICRKKQTKIYYKNNTQKLRKKRKQYYSNNRKVEIKKTLK